MSGYMLEHLGEHLGELVAGYNLTGLELQVLMKYCHRANREHHCAWMGTQTLADELLPSTKGARRSIRRALDSLTAKGLLELIGEAPSMGRGGRPADMYRVCLPGYHQPASQPPLSAKARAQARESARAEAGLGAGLGAGMGAGMGAPRRPEPLTSNNEPSPFISDETLIGMPDPALGVVHTAGHEPTASDDRQPASDELERLLQECVARDLELQPTKEPAGPSLRKKLRQSYLDVLHIGAVRYPTASLSDLCVWAVQTRQHERKTGPAPSEGLISALSRPDRPGLKDAAVLLELRRSHHHAACGCEQVRTAS